MSRIGNIFLVWRKGQGDRRIAVGEIRQNATDGVRFSYIQENVNKAKELGFTYYVGFPDTDKEYTENVLEIFGQRIVKSERNDLRDFYDFWKVDETKKYDLFYMLAQTQAIVPTDNFEFLADFNPSKGLAFITEISGLSHFKVPSSSIQIGDQLNYELELTNPIDSKAVLLFFNDIKLGYVKLIHSRIFHKSKLNPTVAVHHIEKNGLLKRVFIEISYK